MSGRHKRRVLVVLVCAMVAGAGSVRAQDGGDGEVYSLERAIQVALSNSLDINAAESGLRVADQQVREAWSEVFPDLSASASYSRNLKVQQAFLPAIIFDPSASPEDVIPVRFGSDNTWQAGLVFNQPLFEYDLFVGVSAAGRFRDLEGERVRGTTQQVVTSVRQAYLSGLLAVEERRLTANSVERVRQTLEETRALHRAGLASAYDVLRLEVELANLEPNLRRAENAVSANKRALLIEMGLDAQQPIQLEGSLFAVDIADAERNTAENLRLVAVAGLPAATDIQPETLESMAVLRRTELRQQRLNITLEQARLATQRAEYYPTLSVFSNYNITAQENGSPTFFGSSNTRTTTAVTGLSIQVPIFQGFARDSRIQQTQATLGQAEALLERAEKDVMNELHTALESLEESRLRATTQRRAVDQAQRGFEIASAEYRAGLGSQLQMTDAELALRQSEFNYAQAIHDYLLARVRLDAAVGTVPVAAGELMARVGDRGEP